MLGSETTPGPLENGVQPVCAKLHEPPAGRDEQVFSMRWAERSNTCNPRLKICSKTLIPPFSQGLDSDIAPSQHSFFPQISRLMCFSHQNCTLPFRIEHLADVARRGLFSSICSHGNLNTFPKLLSGRQLFSFSCGKLNMSSTRQHFSPARQHFRRIRRLDNILVDLTTLSFSRGTLRMSSNRQHFSSIRPEIDSTTIDNFCQFSSES